MKQTILACAVALTLSSAAFADNSVQGGASAGVEGVEGTGPTTYVPDFPSAATLQAYIVMGAGGSTRITATDQCLAGDKFLVLGIGLPGPSIDFAVTDGTAEECTCTPSVGFEASASVTGNLAIVAMKYLSGTDVFPADAAIRIAPASASATVKQVKGQDACGIP